MTAFGGVQFINLVTGVFRSKVAAIWLGSQGVGFLGLLLTTFNLIVGTLNLGLPTSVVKHLSASSIQLLPKRIKIVKILAVIIGMISAALCFCFAAQLSLITFETDDFTWAFRLLAISVFFKQFSTIYSSILRSTGRLKQLANANIIASIIGIFFTVPLYYYFQLRGIVYNLITLGFVEAIIFYIYFKRLKINNEKVNKTEFLSQSKKMAGDGFFYNLSSFTELLAAYVLQMFISNYGGLKILGQYIAGYTILNSYVALIFTVMSIDYFPRLSKNNTQNNLLSEEVNHQLYIGIIILFPILLLMLLFSHIFIILIYTKEFMAAEVYLQIAMMGIFFKLFSWTVSFVLLAKGSRRLIIQNSIIYNIIFLFCHIFGYLADGLRGLAIGYTIYFLIYLLGNYWQANQLFSVKIESKNIKTYIACCVIIMLCIFINFTITDSLLKKIIISMITIIASAWSLRRLNHIFKWIK
ncbi:Membrane protein involved in the export of O-antigen and teichoic acid [Epilithonimonas bovis DSM 19482]|uniref:Membrane protein involved in the export of O-antigen and teichoic acid n=2 Tax=Epilithonimonas TaxID=2782229 RepID=A0A1U7PY32_9FLAO|nr:Membrane protein involved in the export of O-antigen and teichoic acid [Epilithonimonas bovis DSM 19482]